MNVGIPKGWPISTPHKETIQTANYITPLHKVLVRFVYSDNFSILKKFLHVFCLFSSFQVLVVRILTSLPDTVRSQGIRRSAFEPKDAPQDQARLKAVARWGGGTRHFFTGSIEWLWNSHAVGMIMHDWWLHDILTFYVLCNFVVVFLVPMLCCDMTMAA